MRFRNGIVADSSWTITKWYINNMRIDDAYSQIIKIAVNSKQYILYLHK